MALIITFKEYNFSGVGVREPYREKLLSTEVCLVYILFPLKKYVDVGSKSQPRG